MTTLAHTVSASVISLMIAEVAPSQTDLIAVSLIVPTVLDLDHLVMIFLKRKLFAKEGYKNNLHKARSIFHEMFGVLIVGVLSLFIGAQNSQLATVVFFSYLIHVIEDMIMGISYPFSPVNKRECFLFKFSLKQKAVVDMGVVIISVFLWVMYLRG